MPPLTSFARSPLTSFAHSAHSHCPSSLRSPLTSFARSLRPRAPRDYSRAIIYRIACRDPKVPDTFIGGTLDLGQRMYQHHHNRGADYGAMYAFIDAHGGWSNWSIDEIERWPCDGAAALNARVQHHIAQLARPMNLLPGPGAPVMAECECGAMYQRGEKIRHRDSAAHKHAMMMKSHARYVAAQSRD